MSGKTTYRGINYAGAGSVTNMDVDTGIRYGVISQNSIQPEAVDDVYKPTKPGVYWMRQNYINHVTKQLERSAPEICTVVWGMKPRSKGRDPEDKILIGCWPICGGWRCPIDKSPDYWEWSEAITPPEGF